MRPRPRLGLALFIEVAKMIDAALVLLALTPRGKASNDSHTPSHSKSESQKAHSPPSQGSPYRKDGVRIKGLDSSCSGRDRVIIDQDDVELGPINEQLNRKLHIITEESSVQTRQPTPKTSTRNSNEEMKDGSKDVQGREMSDDEKTDPPDISPRPLHDDRDESVKDKDDDNYNGVLEFNSNPLQQAPDGDISADPV